MLYEILLGLFLLVALALVGVILLQQGKGADMGASFGAGGANTVFGSAGAGNFLTKTTWILSAIGLVLVLSLAYLSSHRGVKDPNADLFNAATPAATEAAPAQPAGDVPAAPVATQPASDVPAAPESKPVSDVPQN